MERLRELLIAKLYDECTPTEAAEIDRALEADAELRAEWEALRRTREFLGDSAVENPIPPAPRVILFPERRRRFTPGAFFSGVAAAALLFTLGLFAAPRIAPEQSDGEVGVSLDTADAVLEALDRIETLEQQNEQLQARLSAAGNDYLQADTRNSIGGDAPTQALLTRSEFEEGLARMLTRFDYQIQQESQYLLSEMAQRDRRYLEAWRMVTREMPALSEQ